MYESDFIVIDMLDDKALAIMKDMMEAFGPSGFERGKHARKGLHEALLG